MRNTTKSVLLDLIENEEFSAYGENVVKVELSKLKNNDLIPMLSSMDENFNDKYRDLLISLEINNIAKTKTKYTCACCSYEECFETSSISKSHIVFKYENGCDENNYKYTVKFIFKDI